MIPIQPCYRVGQYPTLTQTLLGSPPCSCCSADISHEPAPWLVSLLSWIAEHCRV